MPTNQNGTVLSGNVYVRAKLRTDPMYQKNMVALVIVKRKNCDNHSDEGDNRTEVRPTICPKCAESWSWDYDLFFECTAGGRRLAAELGLDPKEAGRILRYRDGHEKRIA